MNVRPINKTNKTNKANKRGIDLSILSNLEILYVRLLID